MTENGDKVRTGKSVDEPSVKKEIEENFGLINPLADHKRFTEELAIAIGDHFEQVLKPYEGTVIVQARDRNVLVVPGTSGPFYTYLVKVYRLEENSEGDIFMTAGKE